MKPYKFLFPWVDSTIRSYNVPNLIHDLVIHSVLLIRAYLLNSKDQWKFLPPLINKPTKHHSSPSIQSIRAEWQRFGCLFTFHPPSSLIPDQ